MNIYFYVVDVISYLFEAYILSVFNKSISKRVRINKVVRLICYVSAATILWIVNFFIQNTWANLVAILILSYLLTLLYEIDIKLRLFGTFIMFVLMSVCEIIVGFILSAIFSDTVIAVNENILYYTVGMFASKSIMLFGVKVFQLKYKRSDIDMPWGLLMAFSVFPIATLFIGIVLIGGFGKGTDPAFAIAGSVGTILLATANILIFYLFERYAKQNRLKYEMEMEQTRLVSETVYLKDLIERQQNSSRQMHDLKNQLFAIRHVLEEDSGRGISEIDKVCSTVNGMQSIVYTNDISVDSLINSKMHNLYNTDVAFNCECFISNFGKIDRMDLCVLLGNLLDNAIEAVDLAEEKFIKLKFLQQGEVINISLSNGCKKFLTGNSEFFTTKGNKDIHGFGLKSVKNIVNKYNGVIDINSENGIFTVLVGLYSA